jgi:hypothetical protein
MTSCSNILPFLLQVEEAKLELKEVVEFLRSPEKFTKLGGKLPSGKHAFEIIQKSNNSSSCSCWPARVPWFASKE